MLSRKLDGFRVAIFRKYYHELMMDYDSLMEEFSDLIIRIFGEGEMVQMKDELVSVGNSIKDSGDLVAMADFLSASILSIVLDLESVEVAREG